MEAACEALPRRARARVGRLAGDYDGAERGRQRERAQDRRRVDAYNEALAPLPRAVHRACASTPTTGCCASCCELYDGHYSRAQGRALRARLRGPRAGRARPARRTRALRARYRDRFSHVLVDEFQDTNPLQNEILELLERDNLFRVGDERQSIYGFRHADVGVFRGHAETAEAEKQLERLTLNFRSRPEMLDAIDLAFGRVWDDYEPLRAPGRRSEPPRALALRRAARDRRHKGRLDAALRRRRGAAVRPRAPRGHAVAGGRGAPARQAHRRADARRAVRASATWRCCCAPPRTRLLRAGARGARHADLRAGRARLLEPAAGGRPARLARGARQPARRAGALLGARLAARGRLARRRWRCSACAPHARPHHLLAHCSSEDGRRSPSCPDGDRERAERFVELLPGRARGGAARVARDADRPRGHARPATTARCSRCPPATGAWPTCAS